MVETQARNYMPVITKKQRPSRVRFFNGPFRRTHIAIGGGYTVVDEGRGPKGFGTKYFREPFIHISFPTPRPAFVASFGAALIGAVVLVALLL